MIGRETEWRKGESEKEVGVGLSQDSDPRDFYWYCRVS